MYQTELGVANASFSSWKKRQPFSMTLDIFEIITKEEESSIYGYEWLSLVEIPPSIGSHLNQWFNSLDFGIYEFVPVPLFCVQFIPFPPCAYDKSPHRKSYALSSSQVSRLEKAVYFLIEIILLFHNFVFQYLSVEFWLDRSLHLEPVAAEQETCLSPIHSTPASGFCCLKAV